MRVRGWGSEYQTPHWTYVRVKGSESGGYHPLTGLIWGQEDGGQKMRIRGLWSEEITVSLDLDQGQRMRVRGGYYLLTGLRWGSDSDEGQGKLPLTGFRWGSEHESEEDITSLEMDEGQRMSKRRISPHWKSIEIEYITSSLDLDVGQRMMVRGGYHLTGPRWGSEDENHKMRVRGWGSDITFSRDIDILIELSMVFWWNYLWHSARSVHGILMKLSMIFW